MKTTTTVLIAGAVALLLCSSSASALTFFDEPAAVTLWPAFRDVADFESDFWNAWPLLPTDMARWHRVARAHDRWLDSVFEDSGLSRLFRVKPTRSSHKGVEQQRSESLRRMRERFQAMEAADKRRELASSVQKNRGAERIEFDLAGFRAKDIEVRTLGETQIRVIAQRTGPAGFEVQQRLLTLPDKLRGAVLTARFDGRMLTIGAARQGEEREERTGIRRTKDKAAAFEGAEESTEAASQSVGDTKAPISGSWEAQSEKKRTGVASEQLRCSEAVEEATVRDES